MNETADRYAKAIGFDPAVHIAREGNPYAKLYSPRLAGAVHLTERGTEFIRALMSKGGSIYGSWQLVVQNR